MDISAHAPSLLADQRQKQRWQRYMRWLALLSIVWNLAEAVSGIALGALDSQVEYTTRTAPTVQAV